MAPSFGEAMSGIRGAWLRYRIMAFIVGTALLVLVCIAMPLQYWGHEPLMAEIVAPIHGYFYIVYLITGADLARRAHWRLGRIVLVVSAGFVPLVAFLVEHRVTRQMRGEGVLDGLAPAPVADGTA